MVGHSDRSCPSAQAGATGDPTSPGRASQTAGPSAGYAGRIRARIKPNIVYSEAGGGKPLATVTMPLLASETGGRGSMVNAWAKSSSLPLETGVSTVS